MIEKLDLHDFKIKLGSRSPRRAELLKKLNIDFETVNIIAEEDYPKKLKPKDVPVFLAKKKSKLYPKNLLLDNEILITADTIVCLKNKIINKPEDEFEAKKMLLSLKNKTHKVYTAVCIRSNEKTKTFVEKTNVKFGNPTEQEIEYYIDNYKPYDKAGAYGIQEWIGFIGIEKIKGCYYNVVGFPVYKFYKTLKKFVDIK